MNPTGKIATFAKGRYFAARHKTLARSLSGVLPYFVVNEFPKSGGTWLAQMLAEALEVPFRRNQPLRLERSIVHGHFLSPWGLRNVVVIWRDPRDIIVSLYFHSYFVNEHQNAHVVAKMKNRLPFADYGNVKANLPEFIRFIHTTPVVPRFTWEQFAENWIKRPNVLHTSYEALRADTATELQRIVCNLTGEGMPIEKMAEIAERHQFSKVKADAQKKQAPGMELSFVRAGSIGGWRKHFCPESERVLEACGYQNSMEQLGYLIPVRACQ